MACCMLVRFRLRYMRLRSSPLIALQMKWWKQGQEIHGFVNVQFVLKSLAGSCLFHASFVVGSVVMVSFWGGELSWHLIKQTQTLQPVMDFLVSGLWIDSLESMCHTFRPPLVSGIKSIFLFTSSWHKATFCTLSSMIQKGTPLLHLASKMCPTVLWLWRARSYDWCLWQSICTCAGVLLAGLGCSPEQCCWM